MILKQLKIKGFRSFCEEAILNVDPDVTVLTGANDVGKSALLHLIRMLFRNEKASESDLNYATRRTLRRELEKTSDFSITATFTASKIANYLSNRVHEGWTIEISYFPNSQRQRINSVLLADGTEMHRRATYELQRLPTVIDLSFDEEIKSRIDLDCINESEDRLLSFAFGHRYRSQLLEYSEEMFKSEVRGAVKSLNLKLKHRLPESLNLGFEIEVDRNESDGLSFTVGVSDQLAGDTPIMLRGAGARKLLRLFASLLYEDPDQSHVIIIVDEPENSLHADAQHSLRGLLDQLGCDERMQVIFATHSPSMIYPTYPKRLRLLTRELSENTNPTSRIHNKPYTDGNFQMIRSSLGMSPADSLLYAPITVIVEGATETLGLSRLFRRLIESPVNEIHKELDRIISLIHFLGAGGSSFVRWAKMAHSQGANVIAFVDGDQVNNAKRIRDEFEDVPIIHFDETKEIEDIVPRHVYFEALAKYVASNNSDSTIAVSEDEFVKWETNNEFHPRVLFSKRVGKWYEELFDYGMEKAEVMDLAIQLADLKEMDLRKIDDLIEAIRDAADNLH